MTKAQFETARARCEAFGLSEAVVSECFLCIAGENYTKDLPAALDALAEAWGKIEALEAAIQLGGIPCDSCRYNNNEHERDECHYCIEYEGENYRWCFDEARFIGGER